MVSPVDCFSGDGPIVSIKLLYKPKDDTSAWSSIVGMCLLGGWGTQVGSGWEGMAGLASGDLDHPPSPGTPMVMLRRMLVAGQIVGHGHGIHMSSWPTVDNSENITLMNLRPVTAYIVKVQLSRPGDGGEGSKGPEAIMVTECLGEHHLPHPDLNADPTPNPAWRRLCKAPGLMHCNVLLPFCLQSPLSSL